MSSSAAAGSQARSSTPHRIQCETVDCNLETEVCCVASGKGRCVPRSGKEALRACAQGEDERRCDETADCDTGARCCYTARGDQCSEVNLWACKHGESCSPSSSEDGEVCLPGSRCKNGPCQAEQGQTWGLCPHRTSAMACGNATCSPGDGCCWDVKTKTGTCMKADGPCETEDMSQARNFLFCERPGNCDPGYACFTHSMGSSTRVFQCGTRACDTFIVLASSNLCDSAADCEKTMYGSGDTKYTLTGCKHSEDLPPGVKMCDYR